MVIARLMLRAQDYGDTCRHRASHEAAMPDAYLHIIVLEQYTPIERFSHLTIAYTAMQCDRRCSFVAY
jgi:hypothetical protein